MSKVESCLNDVPGGPLVLEIWRPLGSQFVFSGPMIERSEGHVAPGPGSVAIFVVKD